MEKIQLNFSKDTKETEKEKDKILATFLLECLTCPNKNECWKNEEEIYKILKDIDKRA